MICVDPEIVNWMASNRNIPIPPKLMEKIKQHIVDHELQLEDKLLQGLSGKGLEMKHLNRITEKINKELGWLGEKQAKPHGYRTSIPVILDERGMEHGRIKYLLGQWDSLIHHLRSDNRINALRKQLTKIEGDIYQELHNRKVGKKIGAKIEDDQYSKNIHPRLY